MLAKGERDEQGVDNRGYVHFTFFKTCDMFMKLIEQSERKN